MREAVYVRDRDMSILYINPAAEQLTGWPLAEAEGKKCYEVFGDENAECKHACPVEKAMAEGVHVLHHEGSLKTRAGEILKMRVSISPVSGEEGLAGAVLVMEDITRLTSIEKSRSKTVVALEREIERCKRVEAKLKESESQKRAILDGITTNLAFVNEDLEILWVNKAAADSVAKLPSQMLGHKCHEFWADPGKPCDRCPTAKAFETERSEHTTIVTPDGRVWDEKGEPVFDAEGRLMGVIEIALDITERYKMEETLRVSEQKYRILSENIPCVVYSALPDEHSTNLHVSGRIEELTGYSVEEFLENRTIYPRIIHPDDTAHVWDKMEEHRKQKSVLDVEYRIVTKAGEVKWIRDRANPMLDENGEIASISGFMVDITEWKKAEEELVKEKNFSTFILDSLPGTFYLFDAQGWIMRWNNFLERASGYSSQEIGSMNLLDFFPEDEKAKLQESVQEVFTSGETYVEAEWATRGGERIPYYFSARRVYVQDRPCLVGVGIDITDRKRIERALQESEEKYRNIFDNAFEGIFQTTPEGRLISANQASARILGYASPEEIISQATDIASQFYARPEDREEVKRRLEDGARLVNQEVQFRRKDGTPIWVSLNAHAVMGEGGKVLYYEGTIEDITARKRAEEELAKSEALLKAILDVSPVGITLVKNRKQQWANRTFCDLFGYEPDEMEDVDVRQFYMSDDDYRRTAHAMYDGITKGEVRETELLCKRRDGTSFLCLLRATLLDDVGSLTAIAIFLDITKRKKAEEALYESEARHRVLFNDSKDGVYITDRDGAIIEANQAYFDLLGYTREEIIGGDIRTIYVNPSDREKFVKAIESRGFLRDYPLTFRRKDGKEIDCLLTSSLRRATDGTILGYHGIMRDVTEQKNLQRQLLQAQKMEALGTLAGGVAHDFNNILQVALGYSDLLLGEERLPGSYRADLQKIHESAKRGADLVQRLLTFGRKAETKPRPLNLNRRINEMAKMIERTIPKMIDIQLLLAEGLDAINADPTQMDQILMNLAVNARDAMPDGGKLIVETANIILDEEYAKTHLDARPGAYVRLMVTDTGSGMDKDTLEHIFEPFYTTKRVGEGTGLGLAVVHGIIQQHGGHVRCYSEPGQGTTFKIYFPALVSAEDPETKAVGALPKGGSETILLVDDEAHIVELGRRILSKSGYTVLIAKNGREALELYSAEREKISLVILDLIMPEMGGKQCLEGLLSLNPSIKVLIASGYSASGPTKDVLSANVKGFINKPYDIRQMLEVIRSVLDAD